MSSANQKLTLSLIPDDLAVCKLDSNAVIPAWALSTNKFISITRTDEELSIVCEQSIVPANIQSVNDWRAFKVEGPLDFSLTGILFSIAKPLAENKISIFAISTFDTDYILIRKHELAAAISILSELFILNDVLSP